MTELLWKCLDILAEKSDTAELSIVFCMELCCGGVCVGMGNERRGYREVAVARQWSSGYFFFLLGDKGTFGVNKVVLGMSG